MAADITLRGPGDVLATLPYQLGYHPAESVVVVALDGRRLAFVARCDIPPESGVTETVEALVEPIVRERFGAVVLVGYDSEVDASRPLLTALVEALELRGVEVLSVDAVRDGRRYSLVCSEQCCPPEGDPVPDPAAVPAVAELVALGRAPLPSRAAVERLVEPDALGPDTAVPRVWRVRRRVAREVGLRAWAEVLTPPGEPGAHSSETERWPPRVVADAAGSLADVALRDALVGWLAPGVLPRSALDGAVVARVEASLPRWAGMGSWTPPGQRALGREILLERLLGLTRAVPDVAPSAAAVCTVAAHVAWAQGDGALARAALDRALRLDPSYRLAQLLARLVENGLRMTPRDRPDDGEVRRAG
jgi:hypothetical protein